MKAITFLSLFILASCTKVQSQSNAEYGYYLTKEDYLSKKLTVQEKMQESENYNIGIIKYKDKNDIEHKFNCIREKIWGFRYIDGCDYMYMNGFFAKIVVVGKRLDLVISPKAAYKMDENGNFSFTPSEEGKKINFYFLKGLDPATEQAFDKHISDEKVLLKEYQSDRDNYGEFINKQMKYLKQYNNLVPKPTKGTKKSS